MHMFAELLNFTDTSTFVISVCVVGIVACLYAINIETNAKEETRRTGKPKYTSVCDMSKSMSCTRVLTSTYAHMVKYLFNLDENSIFNYSNAQYGLVFYCCLLIFHLYPFTLFPYHTFIFLCFSVASVIGSCGLAWILYHILHNLCMICVCMYVVNCLLLTSAVMHLINM